jgi:CSLREA domain-containing protein
MERTKNRRRMRGQSILVMALLLMLLPWAGTVHAANLTVTKTADTNDGVCDADCSLREAIGAAASGDTITVPASPVPYNLSLSHLFINKNLTITGSGMGSTIIEQTKPGFRVFDIGNPGGPAPVVNISRLTIKGGQAISPSNSEALPGHTHGGGIHNHGTVNLTNVTITGNSSTDAAIGGGGGIWNAGAATMVNDTIADNSAPMGKGGGIGGAAPTLTNTIVANNTGGNCSVAIAAGSNNLQFPGTTCGGMIPTADPLLGPLTGGVYPLLASSPAIDTGTNTGCPPTDELGTARPQGAACDIGAFEFVPADVTPPVIVANVAPSPNANGWNNTDVTVTWNVSDPESGIASSSGCGATTLTSETAGTTLTCSATNGAGLSSSKSVTVKIDKTPPTVTYGGGLDHLCRHQRPGLLVRPGRPYLLGNRYRQGRQRGQRLDHLHRPGHLRQPLRPDTAVRQREPRPRPVAMCATERCGGRRRPR